MHFLLLRLFELSSRGKRINQFNLYAEVSQLIYFSRKKTVSVFLLSVSFSQRAQREDESKGEKRRKGLKYHHRTVQLARSEIKYFFIVSLLVAIRIISRDKCSGRKNAGFLSGTPTETAEKNNDRSQKLFIVLANGKWKGWQTHGGRKKGRRRSGEVCGERLEMKIYLTMDRS